MPLLTDAQRQQLLMNGSPELTGQDHYPVVLLHLTDPTAQWMLTELNPEDPDMAFGICDLGYGYPELGCVSMNELERLDGKRGEPVICDTSFKAKYPLSIYAKAAGLVGHVTQDEYELSLGRELPIADEPLRDFRGSEGWRANPLLCPVAQESMMPLSEKPDYYSVPQIELSYHNPVGLHSRPVLMDAGNAYEVLMSLWDEAKLDLLEQANMLVLNRAKQLLGLVQLSTGGTSFTSYDTRLIIATALKANAASIILAHNHPSGNLTPSEADNLMTAVLEKACLAVGIGFDDHLIVTRCGYYSFSSGEATLLTDMPSRPKAAPDYRP